MWRIRLLCLGLRYVPMRPDTFLVATSVSVILIAGTLSMWLALDTPTFITLATGIVVSTLQLGVMGVFPRIADGMSWNGLISEELKTAQLSASNPGMGLIRRQLNCPASGAW